MSAFQAEDAGSIPVTCSKLIYTWRYTVKILNTYKGFLPDQDYARKHHGYSKDKIRNRRLAKRRIRSEAFSNLYVDELKDINIDIAKS